MVGGQSLEYRLLLLHLHLTLHLVELLRVVHFAGNDIELRARRCLFGIHLVALSGRSQCPAFVEILGVDKLGREGITRVAHAQHLAGGGISGGTVASLYHKLVDYTMKQSTVVISLLDQLHEVVAMRGGIVVQFHLNVSHCSLHKDNCLLMAV